MNDLEEEYKALVKDDIPDLWDRIEKELEPKQNKVEVKKVKVSRIIKFGGFAVAACLCVTVAGAVWMNNGTKNADFAAADMGNSAITNNSEDMFFERPACEDAVPFEEAEYDRDEIYDNSVSEKSPSLQSVSEYHLMLEVMETEPDIKCRVTHVLDGDGQLQTGDEIFIEVLGDVTTDWKTGDEVEVFVRPVNHDSGSKKYRLMTK